MQLKRNICLFHHFEVFFDLVFEEAIRFDLLVWPVCFCSVQPVHNVTEAPKSRQLLVHLQSLSDVCREVNTRNDSIWQVRLIELLVDPESLVDSLLRYAGGFHEHTTDQIYFVFRLVIDDQCFIVFDAEVRG